MFRSKPRDRKSSSQRKLSANETREFRSFRSRPSTDKDSSANGTRNSRETILMNIKGKDLYRGVLIPLIDPTEQDEFGWIAGYAVDFVQRIHSIYDEVVKPCESLSDEMSSLAEHGLYPFDKYADHEDASTLENFLPRAIDGRRCDIEAQVYYTNFVKEYLLDLVNDALRLVHDKTVFQRDPVADFPPNFVEDHAKPIFDDVLRFYSVIWSTREFHQLTEAGLNPDATVAITMQKLSASFRQFLYFAFKWDVLKPCHLNFIKCKIEEVRNEYEASKLAYEDDL